MGLSTPGMAKYHISLVHKTKGILAVTMEFSTGHLVLCNRINLSGCGWLKPDQVLYSGKVYYLQVLSYKESNQIMFGWI